MLSEGNVDPNPKGAVYADVARTDKLDLGSLEVTSSEERYWTQGPAHLLHLCRSLLLDAMSEPRVHAASLGACHD